MYSGVYCPTPRANSSTASVNGTPSKASETLVHRSNFAGSTKHSESQAEVSCNVVESVTRLYAASMEIFKLLVKSSNEPWL